MLQATNIHKTYAQLQVLKGVSMQISKGEIVSIIGSSGAGKSTLLHILGTLDTPDKGEILFRGEKLSQKHISQIGYLPEERGLYKKMFVYQVGLPKEKIK